MNSPEALKTGGSGVSSIVDGVGTHFESYNDCDGWHFGGRAGAGLWGNTPAVLPPAPQRSLPPRSAAVPEGCGGAGFGRRSAGTAKTTLGIGRPSRLAQKPAALATHVIIISK
jgi:hypothetical protein